VTTRTPARTSATLKDVARMAGVSTATIARVLHNKGYVAKGTRRAVEAALEESGYQINAVAQGLRIRRTFTLGHVLQRIAPNPFFAEVALGAQQEADRQGCGVVVVNTQGDPEREKLGVETLIRRRVDAILFTTWADEANVGRAVAAGIPVVQVERFADVETHRVTVDNQVGAREAVEHLLNLGHRRIAFIGVSPNPVAHPNPDVTIPPKHRRIERERLAGYLEALDASDVLEREWLIDLEGTYYSTDHARAVVCRWLERPVEQQPTAIFATCDMLAAGVLQELYAHGLRVPDDISVIGFDDTYACYLSPPLTTVEQPTHEIGQAAARLAIATLSHTDGADQHRTERLVTRLVVRESTAPPRKLSTDR
jgi:DNA-binding LacI/PurR family transcriptional regulator